MNTVIAALVGMLAAASVLFAVSAARPTPRRAPTAVRKRRIRVRRIHRRTRILLAVGGLAGIAAALISNVTILIVVVPVAVVGIPMLVGRQDTSERDMLAALDAWTRSLAAASATGRLTLRDVIGVTRTSAPSMLRPAVDRLYLRLSTTWTTAEALRRFAAESESTWVDDVAVYLVQAADYSTAGLAEALRAIADSLSDQVKLRSQVFKERERHRRVMLQISAITGGTVALVVLFARTPQLAAYSTPLGQTLLLIVLAAMGGLLAWARWIGRTRPTPRFLLTSDGDA